MSKKVYQIVTDRIIEALDRGVVPWAKPWKGGHSMPHNMFSMDPEKGRFYQGANVPMLWMSGHSDPRWMTYSQAKKNGIDIKEGEKPSPIVFWKFVEKKDDNGDVIDKIPLLRYFKVYNAEQCENAPDLPEIPEVDPVENYENCQAMMDCYGVDIEHGGSVASYSLTTDTINIPEAGQFKDVESYWSTLLHQAIHSTAHDDRLKRDISNVAFERMASEMGAAFLCAQMGIERDSLTANHASYIAQYKTLLSEDPKAFMRAAKLARQAADYVLEYTGAGQYAASEDEEAA